VRGNCTSSPCLFRGFLLLLCSFLLITSPGSLARTVPVSPFLEMGKGGVVHSPLTHLGGMSPGLLLSSLPLPSSVAYLKQTMLLSCIPLSKRVILHSSYLSQTWLRICNERACGYCALLLMYIKVLSTTTYVYERLGVSCRS